MNTQEERKKLATMLVELRKNGFENKELKRKLKYILCIDDSGDSLIEHVDYYDYDVLPYTVFAKLISRAEGYGYDKDTLGVVLKDDDEYGTPYLVVKHKVKVSDKEYLSYISKLYADWVLSNLQSSVVEKLSSLLGCKVNPSHIDKIKDILKDL